MTTVGSCALGVALMSDFPKLLDPDLALAGELFDQLAEETRKGDGIERDSYGAGEQAAHDIIRRAGEFLDLEIHTDAALNLYLTYPGTDRSLPSMIIGSHLDSVPQGGNFDGAAGVVAGLAVFAGFRRSDYFPPCDVTVMAIRAEEAVWFDVPYIGSYAAFGELPAKSLEVTRSDSGRSLAEHMGEAGCNLDAIRAGEAYLHSEQLRAYMELHIEQGPSLVNFNRPVGIVSAIRGNLRYRNARCLGQYGHSGALSRGQRRDAVAATTALIHHLNQTWDHFDAGNHDLVFTVGELTTDPAFHGPSKVAGETRFVLDFRSTDEKVMHRMAKYAEQEAERLEEDAGVTFDLGTPSFCEAAQMDEEIIAELGSLAEELKISAVKMPSGAGHDAVVFANFGVPSAMIFVRNQHGSHNPKESMNMSDFSKAARLLSAYLITMLD